MAKQPVPVAGFIDAVKAWADTVERAKPDSAQIEVAKLQIFGNLLAEDEEFARLFRQHLDGCSDNDTTRAMGCVYAFFNAVADTTRPGMFRSGGGLTTHGAHGHGEEMGGR